MLVNISNLAQAIKSGERATRVIIKLTKKNGRAFLAFEITEFVGITQEVPISIKSVKTLPEFMEPEMPEPEVLSFATHGPPVTMNTFRRYR